MCGLATVNSFVLNEPAIDIIFTMVDNYNKETGIRPDPLRCRCDKQWHYRIVSNYWDTYTNYHNYSIIRAG